MEQIGIYAALSGTANNVANLQVPRAGRIRGIQWFLTADLDADVESCFAELSLLPVFQSSTNNTRNLLFNCAISCNLTTSGATISAANGFCPLDVPVTPLQILYVNVLMTGTAAGTFGGVLHFQ